MSYHPGVTEIEWLSSLKTVAEEIGSAVLGRTIRWRVETTMVHSRDRSDVVVEFEDGTLVITGEAKRPDDPHGVTPLDTHEVDDAIGKAQHHGSRWCFTTNFWQIAVFDAGPGLMAQSLARLQGDPIEFVPQTLARSIGWWSALSDDARSQATMPGLRALFERCRMLQIGERPSISADVVVLDFFSRLTAQLVEPLWRRFLTDGRGNTEIRTRALTAGLDPDNDQDCRHLVAQGVFEVLSAGLFYRVLQNHFDRLDSFLGGTAPRSAAVLARTVVDSLSEAESLSGDYQSILRLSAIGRWVLSGTARETLAHWVALLAFIDRLDLSVVSSDVLGSIFERLITPERRHELGQHYTQPRLARSMAAWAVTSPDITVLDFACGAGTFLVETYGRHRSLGLTHDDILAQTFGNDIDTFAVHLAAINLATRRIRFGVNHPNVRLGDAFDLRPGIEMLQVAGGPSVSLPRVDVVITNPPYARAHPDESAARNKVQRLLGPDAVLPETAGINFGAWFVLLAHGLVRVGGRLAFVLQSSVLQNENLDSWRHWVREHYDLVIWHTEDDVWFSDARVATCVLLMTPRPEGTTGLGDLHFVEVREPAAGDLSFVHGVPTPAGDCDIRDLSDTPWDDDLLIAGTLPQPLSEFAQAAATTRIGMLTATTARAGQKLGHKFFKLSDQEPGSDAVVRRVTGMDIEVRINRRYLTPLLVSPKDIDDFVQGRVEDWLLTVPETLPNSQSVQEYVRAGRTHGVHLQPSVRARGESWWSITAQSCDIAVPMSGQFRHQVATLSQRGVATNNFNVLEIENASDIPLIAASLTSAFGALARLYVSGELGCEGARRVLLSQFKIWPVLDPAAVSDSRLRDSCARALDRWHAVEASEIDVMTREEEAAWRALTLAVARAALGRSGTAAAAADLADRAIAECRATVARRRLREAAALSGRGRQSGGRRASIAARFEEWANQSALYPTIVEGLTSGSAQIALHEPAEIENLALFSDHHPLASAPNLEMRLIAALGAGFEAAWPDASRHSRAVEQLASSVERLLVDAVNALIGDPPDVQAARQTYEQLAVEARTAIRRRLQADVRRALS
jgi:predicted RNA methylase